MPLSDISLILIDNFKLACTINILNACSFRNIPVVICGDNHHPYSIVLPLHGHLESTKVLFEQMGWSEEYKSKLWKVIIKRKIENQLFVLSKTSNEVVAMDTLRKTI